MNFALTEEQRQLADSVQRLLAEANDFESRRKRLAGPAPDRLALWPQFADMGVIAAAFDERHGGFAGDARTIAVVLASLGESLVVEPYLANAVIVGRVLQHSNTGAARALIEDSIAGRAVVVLAHDAGTDPFAVPGVCAEGSGEDIVLTGMLRCVRHADVASGFLVPAARDGVTVIYHLPRATAGLSISTYRLMDGAGAADLHLNSVHLPANALMTFDVAARDVLHDALEWGLVGLSAEAAGIIGALNRATFAYLNSRKQFGASLASFQALQHRAADMFIAAEEVAAAVNYAVASLLEPPGAARSAAICAAKVTADGAGRRVGHEAVQMHGGMGVSDELNVSHYARRLATIRAELGSADTHRQRLASLQ
jgi:alkylation response protein AidB-like acyl-CoA dehydrogenase